jgi:hypothetical protein
MFSRRLLVPSLFVVVLGALVTANGCNGASLTQPSDGGLAACDPHGVPFCDAGAPGSSGCLGDPNDPSSRYLSTTAPAPVGCKANIIGSQRDSSGQCALAGSCVCTGPDDGGVGRPTWDCTH